MAPNACPECGADLSEAHENCPQCGYELDPAEDPDASPQPGCRSVGWALLFVLALPIAVYFQYTRDAGEAPDTTGPAYACTQFVKSRLARPSAAQIRTDRRDSLANARHRIEGSVAVNDTLEAPYNCLVRRRDDGAWELVEIELDSALTTSAEAR
jgi:hypothetical protein